MPLHIGSEVGRLRQVVVQPPGIAHQRMLPAHIDPASRDYLLFDDLIDVDQARREHDELCAVLGTTAQVHRLEDLLTQVLATAPVRSGVVARVVKDARLSDAMGAQLEQLSPADLTATLIGGTLGGGLDDAHLMAPVPNLIFTRDLAAMVGDTLVMGHASKAARRRERLLAWAVADHHPLFADTAVARASKSVRQRGFVAPLTVEGGDVLVISDSLACIGASERTTWSMIVSLTDELLDQGFTRVLVVEMPKQRSSMHLDTVFTVLDWDRCVVYRPLTREKDPEYARIIRLRRVGGATVVEEQEGDLLEALAWEGHPFQAVLCGGGHPVHERREQWTDGANYVALGPGVVLGYARNQVTASHMGAAGFRVLEAPAFLKEFEQEFHGDADALFHSGRRYAIHVRGFELSRGRGGPRCLTLPIERD